MEHESFEDEEVARLLNNHFVSIKVDREERPDLDQIYMASVQLLTGQGGWPMSVFLTPDLKPFHGGTYYPPHDRYQGQMPSFRRVLQAIIEAWRDRHSDVENAADQITQQLQEGSRVEPGQGALNADLIRNAVHNLSRSFDARYGG